MPKKFVAPADVETYRITGYHGSTGEPIDVTKTFNAYPPVGTAKEVAADWAYNYFDKGAFKLERIE